MLRVLSDKRLIERFSIQASYSKAGEYHHKFPKFSLLSLLTIKSINHLYHFPVILRYQCGSPNLIYKTQERYIVDYIIYPSYWQYNHRAVSTSQDSHNRYPNSVLRSFTSTKQNNVLAIFHSQQYLLPVPLQRYRQSSTHP